MVSLLWSKSASGKDVQDENTNVYKVTGININI